MSRCELCGRCLNMKLYPVKTKLIHYPYETNKHVCADCLRECRSTSNIEGL